MSEQAIITEVNALDGIALRIAVATEVLGYVMERIRPDWYDHDVLLFRRPGSGLIDYSWDERSCNAMMFRNGTDKSDGTAPPLPNWATDDGAVAELIVAMRDHPDVNARVLRLVAYPYNRTYAAFSADPKDREWSEGNGLDATPLAICRAAVVAVRTHTPSTPHTTEPL